MIEKLFEFQRGLMEKLAPVETELGYTPPPVPLDFAQRAHQDWFRLMSWYLTEEIVEALTATDDNRPEELADCLHFAIELCILAGVTGADMKDRIHLAEQLNFFEEHPWTYTLADVQVDLGLAANLLKAKHWKRNPQPTDPNRVKEHLSNMLYKLIQVMKGQGICYHQEYMKKHAENENRIKTHY